MRNLAEYPITQEERIQVLRELIREEKESSLQKYGSIRLATLQAMLRDYAGPPAP